MDREEIEARKAEIVAKWGPWTAEQIDLGHGVFTGGFDSDPGNRARLRSAAQTIADQFGREGFKGRRVLDLACLEGKFSVEFARHGARVVAVDVREANAAKAEFAATVLGLPMEVRCLDALSATPAELGTFDAVFCAGLLYHFNIDHVLQLLRVIFALTDEVAVIETCYSLGFDELAELDGARYFGRSYVEFTESEFTPEQVVSASWSSNLDHVVFFPTEASLVRAIQQVGFSSVYRVLSPPSNPSTSNRATFVARKCAPLPVLTGEDTYRDMAEAAVLDLPQQIETTPGKGRALNNPHTKAI